jgi:hypothetical protein
MNMSKASFIDKCLLVFLLLYSTGSFAALTKWVDAEGKVHYSDQPPPANVKAQTLRPTATSDVPANAGDTSAASAPKTIAEREAELKKAQQEKQVAAEKAAREQARVDAKKTNCETSQQNLKTLQSDLRLSEVNTEGERVYLSDEQRQKKIEKAKQDIATYCD